MKRTLQLFILLPCMLLFFFSCTSKKITLESLLEEMTDREGLTHYPVPAYTIKQFSSYDRQSQTPDQDGWYANRDYTQFIREEKIEGRREFVMFDANGPGAVVRFWMTFAGAGASEGTLRIYIDNIPEPVIEDSVLTVLSGGLLAGDPLSTSVSPLTEYQRRGHNLYLPLPYAQHCKITYECDSIIIEDTRRRPSVYYNINYRTYAEGTAIESFSMAVLERLKELIAATGKTLLKAGASESQETFTTGNQTLSSGDSLTLTFHEPSKAICEISVSLAAENMNQALRSTVLSIVFDGNNSVWVPIGEFFGTGYQVYPSHTWYTLVTEDDTMKSWWIMPYREGGKFHIINFGEQPVEISAEISVNDYDWTRNSMYFGASWHEFNQIHSARPRSEKEHDWHFDVNYINLKGEGVYAGDALTVFNTADAWWGEGDEKIFVDGEDFPSCIGTGTEDYYGYAWCRPEIFSHPFIAQPTGAGNFHPGMTVNTRYRSLDAMPFSTSIQSDIELWHWAQTKINFAMTAYWYVKPGFISNVEPDPEMVKNPVAMKRTDIYKPIVDENGVLEGEWIQLFNGEDLTGWDIKISGYELNDNYKNTFRVEDGLLKIRYDGYEKFNGEFGHIFFKQKFSHYILRVEYRFVGEQVQEGPGWAFKNNGAMLHSQSAESMGLDQDFPVSIEAQFLGGSGEGERTTGNLCTPGTNVVIDGELITQHCTSSSSKTFHGEEWVTIEMIVQGDEIIHHVVNGDTVMTYAKPQIGGGNKPDDYPIPDGTALTEGYIALQAESHPTDFRKVELLDLSKK